MKHFAKSSAKPKIFRENFRETKYFSRKHSRKLAHFRLISLFTKMKEKKRFRFNPRCRKHAKGPTLGEIPTSYLTRSHRQAFASKYKSNCKFDLENNTIYFRKMCPTVTIYCTVIAEIFCSSKHSPDTKLTKPSPPCYTFSCFTVLYCKTHHEVLSLFLSYFPCVVIPKFKQDVS
jgi:hypothetical protein